MKSAKAAIEATKNVVSFPVSRERREKEELAFLPAALEIVETPPSPTGRAIGATIIALFVFGVGLGDLRTRRYCRLRVRQEWCRAVASNSYSRSKPALFAPFAFVMASPLRRATS